MFSRSLNTLVIFIFSKNFRKYEKTIFPGISPKTKPKPTPLVFMKLKCYPRPIHGTLSEADRLLLRRGRDRESYACGGVSLTANEKPRRAGSGYLKPCARRVGVLFSRRSLTCVEPTSVVLASYFDYF